MPQDKKTEPAPQPQQPTLSPEEQAQEEQEDRAKMEARYQRGLAAVEKNKKPQG
jgi:hypothetical protein